MPTKNSFILNKSHEKLIADFLTLFNCSSLPDRKKLFSFLEQHELSCFVKKNAAFKLMTKSEANITCQQIFCLPVSENIADNFIKQLSLFIQQEDCPVVLYWTWELPDNKGFVALHINLKQFDNIVEYQTEILNPSGSHCAHIPMRQMMNKLKTHLTDYRVFPVDSPNFDEPIIGDDIYWTALSLFLKLAQENSEYRNHFKRWNEKNKSMLLYAEKHLLSLVPYVHTNLFYVEQCLAICNMDLLRNFTNQLIPERMSHIPFISFLRNLSKRFPERIRNITLINALRIFVFASILFNQDYGALITLSLIFELNHLTTYVKKKTPEGIASFFLFYLCQLVSTAIILLFKLYMAMSDNLIHRDIEAPRYILYLIRESVNESIKLPIRLVCMFLFLEFFRTLITNTSNNQSGFRAIAFFLIQFFMPFIDKNLFQFNRWTFSQKTEEKILFFIEGKCKEPCQLDIKSAYIWRVLQQIFFNEQIIRIEAVNPAASELCEIKISQNYTNTTSPCADYQFDCRSRFFSGSSSNESPSLTQAPTIQIYPTQKFSYCL